MITLNNNQNKIPRMRTVHEAAQELKKLDVNTAVTEYHIRRLVLDGVLPRTVPVQKPTLPCAVMEGYSLHCAF